MSATAISAAAAGEAPELVFEWDQAGRRHWRLGVLLLFSLLAHAAAFYALQVAYTPTGSSSPPPAQVMLLSPPSPAEQTALARWLDVVDPAAMTQPEPVSVDRVLGSLGFRYVPSYASVLQSFKPLAGGTTFEEPPRTRRPGPVPAGLLPAVGIPGMVASSTQAMARRRTELVFSGAIKDLVPRNAPAFRLDQNPGHTPLDPTVFLVGVPPQGGAPWIFLQASSGDRTEKGADEAAREYLAQLTFQAPSPAAGAWGWATISWGADAYMRGERANIP